MNTIRRALRREHGGIVSILILVPVLLIFIEMIIFAGRVTDARADVNAAASEAARMASLSAGSATAGDFIDEIAEQTLENRGRQCAEAEVRLSPDSTLQRGGIVAVEVTCKIDVSDLGFLAQIAPLGGMTFEIRGVGIESIDPLRAYDGDDAVEEVP